MNQNPSYQPTNEYGSPSYRQRSDLGYSPMYQASTSSITGEEARFLKKKYKQTQNKVFHDFFKTKVCPLYKLNICTKGESCPFAHNEDELREKPNLAKTRLCEVFLETGYCKNGDQCTFAHGESELRSTPDLFKTAICNLWNQGKCNSGDRCRFAHGVEDLRPLPYHYKKKRQVNKPPNTTSYQSMVPQMQMPIIQQQQPLIQPMIYPTQFPPMMINGPTFPQYTFNPTYQGMQQQILQIPYTSTNQIEMIKFPMQGKSPF